MVYTAATHTHMSSIHCLTNGGANIHIVVTTFYSVNTTVHIWRNVLSNVRKLFNNSELKQWITVKQRYFLNLIPQNRTVQKISISVSCKLCNVLQLILLFFSRVTFHFILAFGSVSFSLYLHSSTGFKFRIKKIHYDIHIENMLKYAPMIKVMRIQVNKIQFNFLIIISFDAFVYFLSFVYSFTWISHSLAEEKLKWTTNKRDWNPKMKWKNEHCS